MNDWLHCNKCSIKYHLNIKLFLTECGHIFCDRCVVAVKEAKCLVCEKSNNFIEISKDMDVNVQQYFIPFEAVLKKTVEVYNFQMQQRMRLYQALSKKYAYAKKECISLYNKNKILVRENNMLKNMLMSASRNNKPFQASTPALTSDNSQNDNMSMISSIAFTPINGPRQTPVNFVQSRGMPKYRNPAMYNSATIFNRQRPSPAQMVPNMQRHPNMAPVHRPLGTAASIQDLHGTGKRT